MNSEQRVSLDCQTPDGLAIKIAALEQEEENENTGEEVVVMKRDKKQVIKTQETLTKTETSMFEKIKVLVVDVVNPKFKNFNRPLFLALVVGMITLASFIALFVYLQSECVAQSMTTGTPLITTFFAENDVSCVHWAVKVDIQDGKQEFPPCRMVSMTMEGKVSPMEQHICEHSTMKGYAEEIEREDYPLCVGSYHDDNGTYDPALMVIEFDLCPDPVLTLGSAFGWVAMIELATTMVVLAAGMPCGFLKNDQSTLKTLIGEMNAEENKATIQSGATEFGSTLIEM